MPTLKRVSAPAFLRAASDSAGQWLLEGGTGAYEALLEQVPGVLYVAEPGVDGRWLYVSGQIEALLGWTAAEWMADHDLFAKVVHPDDLQIEADLVGHVAVGERHCGEYRATRRDGQLRWLRDDATLLGDDTGAPYVWTGVLTDVTEQRTAESELERSGARSRSILDTALDAFVAFDASGSIVEWNLSAERIFGWSREEAVGGTLLDTIVPAHLRPAFADAAAEAAVDGKAERGQLLQAATRRRDGTELPVEVVFWRTIEAGGMLFSAFIRDITERTRLESELVRRASRDDLTGLANQSLFQQRLLAHVTAAPQTGFAVMRVSLDDYRSVSESLGCSAADGLVRSAVDRLQGHLSANDGLARVSDGEFAVLMPDVRTVEEANGRSKSLHAALRHPASDGNSELTVRATVGVRHCPGVSTVGVEELLADAGAAVSIATAQGRASVTFEDSMRMERLRRVQLTEALEHAVRRGEISVHYQPYFSFSDGRVCGVEALARWHHPVYGDVSPAEFIVLAENTGQIIDLGRFVLERACRDMAGLRASDPAFRDVVLSVNVSVRQLADNRFQRDLGAVLAETGLPSELFMAELTETALVEDEHNVAERLAAIKSIGVHLAADDFGTRYASLAYLQRFPIDTLKIDRSFVREVHRSSQAETLIGAIIALAKTLGLRTIAEGIEEQEHACLLARLGCDFGQGYLFARPVPVEDLAASLRGGALLADLSTEARKR